MKPVFAIDPRISIARQELSYLPLGIRRIITQDEEMVLAAQEEGALAFISNDINEAAAWFGGEFTAGVYGLEIGACVKIGCSQNVPARIKHLIRQQAIYGTPVTRFVVSAPHSNYRANETALHRKFRTVRKGGEMFAISIEDAADAMEGMSFHPAYLNVGFELCEIMAPGSNTVISEERAKLHAACGRINSFYTILKEEVAS